MRRVAAIGLALALLVVVAGYGSGGGDRPIRIGVLADCRGGFATLRGPMLANAELPLLARGGRLIGEGPEEGVRGAHVGGHPVELVPACTEFWEFSVLVEEVRRLIEVEHVDAVVGPIGDGDSIVLRDVARRYPDVAFVVNFSAPPELTLHDAAPNLYRFDADAAIASAGLGAYAYHELGWRRAALVLDESSQGWAGADAFTAEFCALGGTIAARVGTDEWAPDGSDVDQVPGDVDGTALMLEAYSGASGLLAALAERDGDPAQRLLLGPAFMLDTAAVAALPTFLDGVVSSASIAPAADTPALAAHVDRFAAAFPTLPRELATGPVILPYYDAMEAVMLALESTGGDPGEGGARLRDALARVEADFPDGHVRLDANRQGIRDVTLVRVAHENGQGVLRTIATVPDVEQGFGGILAAAPPPSSAGLPCRTATPPPWAATP